MMQELSRGKIQDPVSMDTHNEMLLLLDIRPLLGWNKEGVNCEVKQLVLHELYVVEMYVKYTDNHVAAYDSCS